MLLCWFRLIYIYIDMTVYYVILHHITYRVFYNIIILHFNVLCDILNKGCCFMFFRPHACIISIYSYCLEPSSDTLKSAQTRKTLISTKSAIKAQKVLIWLLFHFVGHPRMFKQPDSRGFVQHTLTQSHYAWDHATWALHNQHHSPLPQVSLQIYLDGPN